MSRKIKKLPSIKQMLKHSFNIAVTICDLFLKIFVRKLTQPSSAASQYSLKKNRLVLVKELPNSLKDTHGLLLT